MGPKALAAVLALVALGVGSAGAHHSVAGQFDNSKRTKITGTISKIDWINPHTYIYLDVKDDKGQVTTWRLESLPTAMLRKAGLTSEMLMAGGATVTADALMARDGSAHLAWLLKLTYEDGHFYQLAGE
jgi:diphthamide biosynthesis methyltransferase